MELIMLLFKTPVIVMVTFTRLSRCCDTRVFVQARIQTGSVAGIWAATATLGGRARSPRSATRGMLQTCPWAFLVSSFSHPNRLSCMLHLVISSGYLPLMLFFHISIIPLRNMEISIFKLLS